MADLSNLIGYIPNTLPSRSSNSTSYPGELGDESLQLQCCCGSTDCAFLAHNGELLNAKERDVKAAASMGQALLIRHEQYTIDAEREKVVMSAKIEQLEVENKELEIENKKTVEENKDLQDQLEGLNDGFLESELKAKALETTLQSTQTEMRRLENLAARTGELEKNLAILEEEQEMLRNMITRSEAEERNAILGWRRAERGLCDLEKELEKIEREAREERERHVEILGRMQRQRIVERELDTAAGRLKGAAAAVSGKSKHGTNVVSHFVKDILQDNANLQLGIVELREMLMNSNDEVQNLREQLMMHQPIYEDRKDGTHPPTLGAELAPAEEAENKARERVISQALHIHHHYHTPKREDARRPRKKRTSLNSGIFSPPLRGLRSPRSPRSSENTILSQTSVTVPGGAINPNNRWSVQSSQMSDFAPSSVPSSPQSMYRNSALFDRTFDADSSRPTSPGSSVDPLSPRVHPTYHRKRGSEVSARSFAAISNFQPDHVIHEEEDADIQDISNLKVTAPEINFPDDDIDVSNNPVSTWTPPLFGPRLHRTSSHESIISISGLDIHTLKARPSQVSITSSGGALIRPRSRLSSPGPSYSTGTITSASMVTATPTLSSASGWSGTSYLKNAVNSSPNGRSPNSARSVSDDGGSDKSGNLNLGRKVGGWVWGRWGVSAGVTPVKSMGDLKATSTTQLQVDELDSPRRVSTTALPTLGNGIGLGVSGMTAGMGLSMGRGRSPGINQKGPIPGFRRGVERAPSKVRPDAVDKDALAEVLEE